MNFKQKIINSISLLTLVLLIVSRTAISGAVSSADSAEQLVGPSSVQPPEVSARAYVLYDDTTHTFLLGNAQDESLSPASITKVMTVLLALENLELTDTITVTKEMFQDIPNDYVRLGLMAGEVITVEQALYSCMLISANDAAMALALSMADSAEDFSVMMNEKAAELGCTNTFFTNPYGYADPAHLTSAHDMALILAAALKYEDFTRIALTKYYSMPPTNLLETGRGMSNSNKLLPKAAFAYDYFIGGKTGYTDLSGNTFIAGARKDGRTLIVVILGAPLSNSRYSDTRALFDYGFTEYSVLAPTEADLYDTKKGILDHLSETITANSLDISIMDTSLILNDPTTITAPINTQDILYEADGTSVNLDMEQGTHIIKYPLLCSISGSTAVNIGTLEITTKTRAPVDLSVKRDGGNLRILLILIPVILILFVFWWYLRITRARRLKRRARHIRRIRR